MIKPEEIVIPLTETDRCLEKNAGGKGASLSRLIAHGFKVPAGYCLSTRAYRYFIETNEIDSAINIELGRKPLEKMRWEELWDSALRIRSMFLKSGMPDIIAEAVKRQHSIMEEFSSFAVRSSAPGEDSAGLSFAGLHESITDVSGIVELIDAIRIVWSSLWSDAALLYRKEMNLDPGRSAMAVIIQGFQKGGPSGVGFSRDPRDAQLDQSIIEAVPGSNDELVDGIIEPDRWIISRRTKSIIDFNKGNRPDPDDSGSLLNTNEIMHLYNEILAIESKMSWPADVEWTGKGAKLTILQARPITSGEPGNKEDQRNWYLTLRPKLQNLKRLAARVNDELIPRLKNEGERQSQVDTEKLNDRELGELIRQRLSTLEKWRKIYYDEFIPLAHGVRQLGIYYNNEVKPENPYEFMSLLEDQEMIASKRNQLISSMADLTAGNEELYEVLRASLQGSISDDNFDRANLKNELMIIPGGTDFYNSLDKLINEFSHVSFKGENLSDNPKIYIHVILELADSAKAEKQNQLSVTESDSDTITPENKLFEAVGKDRYEEASGIIELGRLSWKLRDDDNILIGRLESQLLDVLNMAGKKLVAAGKLNQYEKLSDTTAPILAEALLNPPDEIIELPREEPKDLSELKSKAGKPRQLVGQPAGPGVASGTARIVRNIKDLKGFKFGEVLICDAIQPTMTHIVPLASGIVERRGGMLIHGAIIARELNIPCVNGVADAVDLISNGELVTVDGFLGIVTVGEPELDLEKRAGGSD